MTPPVMSRHPTNTSRHPPDMSRHPLDTSRHPPNMSRHPPDIPQTRPDTPQTHPDTPQTTPRQRKRILNFNRIICCNLILKFLTDSLGLAQLSPSLFFLKSQWDFPTLTWMNNDHTKIQQARFLKKYKIVSCQLNHLVLEGCQLGFQKKGLAQTVKVRRSIASFSNCKIWQVCPSESVWNRATSQEQIMVLIEIERVKKNWYESLCCSCLM